MNPIKSFHKDEKLQLLYFNEVFTLQEYCKDKRVIEIGAFHGFSTCMIAEVAKYIITIDTFQGTTIGDMDTLKEFQENIQEFNNIDYIIGDSKYVHNFVSNRSFDVLFIDGDHSYAGCYADLINYIPKLEQPNNVVILHDYSPYVLNGGNVIAASFNYFGRKSNNVIDTFGIYKNVNMRNIQCPQCGKETKKNISHNGDKFYCSECRWFE